MRTSTCASAEARHLQQQPGIAAALLTVMEQRFLPSIICEQSIHRQLKVISLLESTPETEVSARLEPVPFCMLHTHTCILLVNVL